MNILVIGKPRSRTSYLGKVLSAYYNLQYISEPYDSGAIMNKHYARLQMLQSSDYQTILYDKQIEWLHGVTKSIFESNNCVAKLFPRHVTCNLYDLRSYHIKNNIGDSRYDTILDPNSYNFRIIPNLSEILKLNKFDKIFFIGRNLIDSPISFAYSIRINQFGFDNNHAIDKVRKSFSNITIDDRDIPYINYIVFEHVLLEKIREFISTRYPCTFLDYDNVVDYVNNNLDSNVSIDLIDPNFNYKEIIKNYSEVENHIQNVYDIFSPKLEKIEFF